MVYKGLWLGLVAVLFLFTLSSGSVEAACVEIGPACSGYQRTSQLSCFDPEFNTAYSHPYDDGCETNAPPYCSGQGSAPATCPLGSGQTSTIRTCQVNTYCSSKDTFSCDDYRPDCCLWDTWYADRDDDGHKDATDSITGCRDNVYNLGYFTITDCDDTNALYTESTSWWGIDPDGDGYSTELGVQGCRPPNDGRTWRKGRTTTPRTYFTDGTFNFPDWLDCQGNDGSIYPGNGCENYCDRAYACDEVANIATCSSTSSSSTCNSGGRWDHCSVDLGGPAIAASCKPRLCAFFQGSDGSCSGAPPGCSTQSSGSSDPACTGGFVAGGTNVADAVGNSLTGLAVPLPGGDDCFVCSGTPTGCTGLAEGACTTASGCYWDPGTITCEGTSRCSGATQAQCGTTYEECELNYNFGDTEEKLRCVADSDGDGYKDSGASVERFCAATCPTGYVPDTAPTDCNNVNPGAYTTYDGYQDGDNDGYTRGTLSTSPCTDVRPTWLKATISDPVDCDDDVNACNVDCTTLAYPDADGDTYGDAGSAGVRACDAPVGHVSNNLDCADANIAGNELINPDGTEMCDGIDNDCNAATGDGADETTLGDACTVSQGAFCSRDGTMACTSGAMVCGNLGATYDQVTAYRDVDGDTYYGTSQGGLCDLPAGSGWSTSVGSGSELCDFAGAANRNPGEADVCDGIDNDCDAATPSAAQIDEDCEWYCDNDDGDDYVEGNMGAGTFTSVWGRSGNNAAEGTTGLETDCDSVSTCTVTYEHDTPPVCSPVESNVCDNSASAYPGATEICDNIDNDCDGIIDEGCDNDGDGYYDDGMTCVTEFYSIPRNEVIACSAGADCNDDGLYAAQMNPTTDWYVDDDRDGYSPGATVSNGAILNTCEITSNQGPYQPNDYFMDFQLLGDPTLTAEQDCNDGRVWQYPGLRWYNDDDADLYRDQDNTRIFSCAQPSVSGNPDWYLDVDEAHPSTPPSFERDFLGGDGTDCNDNGQWQNPRTTWYFDEDDDNYGDGTTYNSGASQCNRPTSDYKGYEPTLALLEPGFSSTTGDCANEDRLYYGTAYDASSPQPSAQGSAIYPGAPDSGSDRVVNYVDASSEAGTNYRQNLCNGIDYNCDGFGGNHHPIICYADRDGDGWYNPDDNYRECSDEWQVADAAVGGCDINFQNSYHFGPTVYEDCNDGDGVTNYLCCTDPSLPQYVHEKRAYSSDYDVAVSTADDWPLDLSSSVSRLIEYEDRGACALTSNYCVVGISEVDNTPLTQPVGATVVDPLYGTGEILVCNDYGGSCDDVYGCGFTDCDNDANACNVYCGFNWAVPSDDHLTIGGYDGVNRAECCGDDPNELTVTNFCDADTSGVPVCCPDDGTDWRVYDGRCVAVSECPDIMQSAPTFKPINVGDSSYTATENILTNDNDPNTYCCEDGEASSAGKPLCSGVRGCYIASDPTGITPAPQLVPTINISEPPYQKTWCSQVVGGDPYCVLEAAEDNYELCERSEVCQEEVVAVEYNDLEGKVICTDASAISDDRRLPYPAINAGCGLAQTTGCDAVIETVYVCNDADVRIMCDDINGDYQNCQRVCENPLQQTDIITYRGPNCVYDPGCADPGFTYVTKDTVTLNDPTSCSPAVICNEFGCNAAACGACTVSGCPDCGAPSYSIEDATCTEELICDVVTTSGAPSDDANLYCIPEENDQGQTIYVRANGNDDTMWQCTDVAAQDQGDFWCADGFDYDPIDEQCIPRKATCDAGFSGNLENGCDNLLSIGDDHWGLYNAACFGTGGVPSGINNVYGTTCCLALTINDYELYDNAIPNNIVVY